MGAVRLWDSGWLSQEASSFAVVTFGWTFTNILAYKTIFYLIIMLFLMEI